MPDTELPVLHCIPQRGKGDCAISALAMLLGCSYEDALEAATGQTRKAHRRGMYTTDILRTAEKLGTPLARHRKWDLEHDTGILVGTIAEGHRRIGHVVVLRWGVIFDPEGEHAGVVATWEPDAYVANKRTRWTELLTRRG